MAKMSNSLVKQFAKTITQSVPQEKSKSSNALGTLVKEGDIFYAMLDGSTFLTPVSMSMSGEEGDRVLVTIQNHSAIVTANITAPGATTKYVERVEADLTMFKDVTVKNLLAEYIRTDEFEAKVGTFGYIKSDEAYLKFVKMDELESKVGTFGYLKTEQLESEVGKFGYIKTGELGADIAKLGYLKADDADLKYANIDLANVNNAWISNGIIKDGSIGSAAIHDGAITNVHIANATIEAAKIKNINADVIDSGTLRTKRLIITGEDGEDSIVQAINLANGVSEALVNKNKLQVASIEVSDLSAFQATIAGFDMLNNAIYSGKTSITDPTSGIYLSTVGLGIGDGSLTGKNESPLQVYADGTVKLIGKNSSFEFNTVTGTLEMNVTNLTISSKTVPTSDEIDQIKQTTTEFIGAVNKWEMKWDKIFNSTDANEDTYQAYITFQNGEQILGNSKSNIKLHLKNDTIQYEDSNGNVLSSYDATNIYLGKNSNESIIDLCNGSGKITGANYEHSNQLSIYGKEGITLYPTENNNVFVSLDSSSIYLYAHNVEKTKGSSINLTSNGIEFYTDDEVSIIGAPLVLWGDLTIHGNTLTIDDMCGIRSDGEGGNVWIKSKSNTYHYEFDAYSDTAARLYSYRNSDGCVRTWVFNADVGSFTADGCINGQLSGLAQFRAVHGNYGFMIRNDGVNTYFLITNAGDPWGSWSNKFPVIIGNSDGAVSFGTMVYANASARISGGGNAAQMSGNGNWISLTSAGATGGHGHLGSGDNYWNNVYYSGSLKKVSDKRKKRDLGELDLDETLTVLQNIKPIKYSMLADAEDVVQYGVFAQDVRDMLQQKYLGYRSMLSISYVGSEKDTTNIYESEDKVSYSVDYTQFVAPLIRGWQYHNSELDTLKRKHQELQGKYNSLEGQVEALREKLHELEMAI